MGALGRLVAFFGNFSGLFLKLFRSLKAAKWSQWLWFYLFTYLGGIIGKVFTLVGVTLAVNEFATPQLTQLVASNLLNLPATWVQLLALTKIDQAITIMMSAMAIAVADRVYVARRRAAWQTPL